jgi:hypothetical protein
VTKEEDAVIAPEGHHDARGLIECESLDVLEHTSHPHGELAIIHAAEPSRHDAVTVHGAEVPELDRVVAADGACEDILGGRVLEDPVARGMSMVEVRGKQCKWEKQVALEYTRIYTKVYAVQ